MTIGKGIGGGFPMSGRRFIPRAMSAKPFGEPSGSSSSYGGNPLAAPPALRRSRRSSRRSWSRIRPRVGEVMLRPLQEMQEQYRFIGDVRGRGLLIGVELVADRNTKEPLEHEITFALFQEALRARPHHDGLFAVIRINPPLVITEDEALRGSRSSTRLSPRSRSGSGCTDDEPTLARRDPRLWPCRGLRAYAGLGRAPGRREDRRGDGRASVAARDVSARAFPKAGAMHTAEELLAAETVDFVDICTPPSSHGDDRAGARRGPGRALRKTAEISAVGCARIAGRAAAAARIVHAVHNWLEAPVCRKVSALLAEGAVGNVHSISWDTSRTGPAAAVDESGTVNWRMDPEVAGGGILFDHGWHAAYCVVRWAGAAPSAVSARLEKRRYRASAVEDTAVLDIGFGRIDGHIHLTWAAEERSNRVNVIGDAGRIDVAGAEVRLVGADGLQRCASNECNYCAACRRTAACLPTDRCRACSRATGRRPSTISEIPPDLPAVPAPPA